MNSGTAVQAKYLGKITNVIGLFVDGFKANWHYLGHVVPFNFFLAMAMYPFGTG